MLIGKKLSKIISLKSCKTAKRAPDRRAKTGWYSLAHMFNICMDVHNLKASLDHIVPLNHTKVCGLHVQDNWQILSPDDNVEKDNKFLVRQIEELTMFQLHRTGMTDKIPKDYLNRIIK